MIMKWISNKSEGIKDKNQNFLVTHVKLESKKHRIDYSLTISLFSDWVHSSSCGLWASEEAENFLSLSHCECEEIEITRKKGIVVFII